MKYFGIMALLLAPFALALTAAPTGGFLQVKGGSPTYLLIITILAVVILGFLITKLNSPKAKIGLATLIIFIVAISIPLSSNQPTGLAFYESEQLIEYDGLPSIDGEPDIHDVVRWIRAYNGDANVLITCEDEICSDSAENCIGDLDVNNDGNVDSTDLTLLVQYVGTDKEGQNQAIPLCKPPGETPG